MKIRGTIKSLNDINIIDNPEVGDCVMLEDGRCFTFTEDGWGEFSKEDVSKLNLQMTQYDWNRMLAENLPGIKNLYPVKRKIREFAYADNEEHIFMLLCRELNYYTIFAVDGTQNNDIEQVEDAMVECLLYNGEILAVDKEGDMLECWVRTTADKEPHVFYFFNYDGGYIKCG